jgi:hypothetical protein
MKYQKNIITVNEGDSIKSAFNTAAELIDAATALAPVDIEIVLGDGSYTINGTIALDGSKLAGSAYSKLSVSAAEGAKPVINGLTKLDAIDFKKVDGEDYFVCAFEKDADGIYPQFRDFYVDGERIELASSQFYTLRGNFADVKNRSDDENKVGLYVSREAVEALGKVEYPTEFTIYVEWEFFKLHVTGVDLNDTTNIDGEELVRLKFDEDELMAFSTGYNAACLSIVNRKYYFSNNLSLITPDTYVYDYVNGLLYYYPSDGKVGEVAYSDIEVLLSFANMQNVSLDGITFTGVTCQQAIKKGYLSGQANTESRDGLLRCAAVLFDTSENVSITGCSFNALGANGILSVNSMNTMKIENCHFNDIAMSAISIGNHTSSWTMINANYNLKITNNLIEHTSYEYPTAVALYISMVDKLELTHNTIRDCSYSGVSIGWGRVLVSYGYGEKINIRHADIAYNRIENYMQLLRDGAAIYVLGANCTKDYDDYFNFMHDNYFERKLDKSFFNPGYYLDGSSSNWHVFDNVGSGSPYTVFSQYNVASQLTWHVLIERIYSTEAVPANNHAPARDTLLETCYNEKTLDMLFEKYPQAKKIADAAGANIN